MNLVGKIFIVLIFVLSLVFASFTVAVYATHKNWRQVVEDPETGLKQQLQRAQERTSDLKSQVDKLKKELAAEKVLKRDALTKLETKYADSEKQVEDQNRQLAVVIQQRDDAVATVKTTQEEIAALREEVTGLDATGNKVAPGLREEVRQAQQERDQYFADSVKLTDELHQARNDYQSLRERNLDLAAQFADAKQVLDIHDLKPVPALYQGTPPTVDGVVLGVGADGLIEISLGTDDGLLKGHTLEVYRQDGSAYLGRVQVTATQADKAACQILPQFRQGHIQGGDRVTTKLR